MKGLLNKAIFLALMALAWTSCSQDEVIADYDLNTAQESESAININLNLNIPDPVQITSRNGEIEEAIKDITVLCFDKDGLALTKLGTTLTPTGEESGSLTVKIPNATRIMHVFANQENIPFEKGMNEKDARLTGLQATLGKMVYWGRIEVPSNLTASSEIKNWWTSEGKTINLLRNHAKIEVVNNTEEFVLQGYTVVYTNAFGMAIPYFAEENVYPTNAIGGSAPDFSINDWIGAGYIHSSASDVTIYGSDETMLEEGEITYVYETPAAAKVPASIIIKGYNTADPNKQSKYWRVAFASEDGKQVNIRRNHRYTVSIEGNILFGDDTFEAALANNSTANSAWLGIADEVTAVKTKFFSLTVENTSYVKIDGTESLSFNFQIEQLGAEAFDVNDLSVTWEAGQNVSSDNKVNYTSNQNGNVFKANIVVALKKLAAGKARQEGSIVIKYGKKLQRKVKVIVIPLQEFTLVSYNKQESYTIDEETGAYVYQVSVNKADYEKDDYTIDGAPIDKLKFSIPSGFPTQLLPFNVLVSTTDFNVVNSPLIFEGAGGYGEDNGIGYKYVYQVRESVDSDNNAVVYEIPLRYINNLLADKVELTLEAENFKPVHLIIHYYTEKD